VTVEGPAGDGRPSPSERAGVQPTSSTASTPASRRIDPFRIGTQDRAASLKPR